MKKRFDYLSSQTGQSGKFSEIDDQVRRVMGQDKDVTGDMVGSSALDGISVLG